MGNPTTETTSVGRANSIDKGRSGTPSQKAALSTVNNARSHSSALAITCVGTRGGRG